MGNMHAPFLVANVWCCICDYRVNHDISESCNKVEMLITKYDVVKELLHWWIYQQYTCLCT